jgi:hypothetical protein
MYTQDQKDIHQGQGGGVLLYVKESIKSAAVDTTQTSAIVFGVTY